MPMSDAYLHFSKSQSLAGLAGSSGTLFPGTYELDFETTVLPDGLTTQAYPDKGSGSPLVVRFQIEVAPTVATYISFCLCFDTATCVPSTAPTIVVQTAPIAVSALTVGAYIPELKIPDQHARFMNVGYYIVGTPGVGTVTAYIDITTGQRHR
jgi:hypothetical protein